MDNRLPRFKPAPADSKRRRMVYYKGVRMTPFRAQRIVELTPLIIKANKDGMTIPKAAEWMGWSVASLRLWVRILGIKWRNTTPGKTKAIDKQTWLDKIQRKLAEGKSQAEIARDLGTGAWNITRFKKANGINVLPKEIV